MDQNNHATFGGSLELTAIAKHVTNLHIELFAIAKQIKKIMTYREPVFFTYKKKSAKE